MSFGLIVPLSVVVIFGVVEVTSSSPLEVISAVVDKVVVTTISGPEVVIFGFNASSTLSSPI